MAGYKYHWKCPNCGTKLVLKMRTTITKRKCPHCGFMVTPEEIDRQQLPFTIGCMIVLAFIVIMAMIWAIPSFFYGLVQFIIGIVVIAVTAFVAYVGYKVYIDRAFDSKKTAFLNSSDFQLVKDFARSELRYENGADEKLQKLLQNKGWNFTPEQIMVFVKEEIDRQDSTAQSTQISDRIKAKNPTNREDYLRAYIDVTHPQENDYLHILAAFLKVSEQEYPKLRDELMSLYKKSDLDEFERRLRNQSG